MTDMPVKYEVLDITPTRALEILEGNTHNRSVRHRAVSKYAADMQNGAWEGENGQSIVIAPDGRVVDGQHRLWAIIESETTQRMLVVSNVPMTAQVNVDTQAKRQFGDVLKLQGETNHTTLAAICRQVALWEAGTRLRNNNLAPSHAQLLDTLDRNPVLREAATTALAIRKNIRLNGSISGLCYWLFTGIDYDDCLGFFRLLRGDHDGLERGHPARVLTDTINNASTGRSSLQQHIAGAYVIKAWNAYRDGRTVAQLKFRPGGATPEQFPEPK